MIPTDDDQAANPRRSFLLTSGGWMTSAWIAANWPAIADAARHAVEAPAAPLPARFVFFNAADAADVEAIAAQIVPSGATPGAREAHAVYFIDRAMATFFADWAHDFRPGLGDFQARFRSSIRGFPSFSDAAPDVQIAYLKAVDRTPFFESARALTLLGMFSSPKYGGNFQEIGWAMMGFKDQHAFTAPYGYYDREYTGFVPYTTERP